MNPNQAATSNTGSLYGNLQSTLAQLAYNVDGAAWRVAKSMRVCVKDADVLELAGYYRTPLVKWLMHHMPGKSVEQIEQDLRTYTGPPADPLLDELRRLLHDLNVANSFDGKKLEEDKGSAHIGIDRYEGSREQKVAQRAGLAALALQQFLTEHGDHFKVVTIKSVSILAYLQSVLGNKDVNTCNNEVATTIDVALDEQFAQVPPHIEVGLRLVKVGFFDPVPDNTNTPHAPSEEEMELAAEVLTSAVEALAQGGQQDHTVDGFLTAVYHLSDLISGGYVRGTAIKKKLENLAQLLKAGPIDWPKVQAQAKDIRFF